MDLLKKSRNKNLFWKSSWAGGAGEGWSEEAIFTFVV